MLFKLGEGNKVINTIVQVKAAVDNLYVIESGITTKDKIVTTGVGKLKNDMVISPQEVPFEEVTKPIKPLFKN